MRQRGARIQAPPPALLVPASCKLRAPHFEASCRPASSQARFAGGFGLWHWARAAAPQATATPARRARSAACRTGPARLPNALQFAAECREIQIGLEDLRLAPAISPVPAPRRSGPISGTRCACAAPAEGPVPDAQRPASRSSTRRAVAKTAAYPAPRPTTRASRPCDADRNACLPRGRWSPAPPAICLAAASRPVLRPCAITRNSWIAAP